MHQFDSNPLKEFLYSILKRAKADMSQRFAKEMVPITPFQYKALHLINAGTLTINEIARDFI